jgi:ferredoxin
MMEALIPALRTWRAPESDLHFEAFGPASLKPAPRPSAGVTELDVAFRRSGRTLAWDGRDANLLDFAERHGIVVESGCRAGACGACETRVLSGSVLYAETPEFDCGPGHCLLCVGTPGSPLRLEA